MNPTRIHGGKMKKLRNFMKDFGYRVFEYRNSDRLNIYTTDISRCIKLLNQYIGDGGNIRNKEIRIILKG